MGSSTTRVLAWVMLVLVIAWGFLLQSVTINELKQTQQDLLAVTQRQQVAIARGIRDFQTVCRLLQDAGIDCPTEGG